MAWKGYKSWERCHTIWTERENRMRVTENFNDDWYFIKAADSEAAQSMEWEKVTLPHTWNNIDGQDGGNDYYRGTCLYRKNFQRPFSWQKGDEVFLEFNGAAMTASVTVNGRLLKTHDGGYSTFRVNITDVMEEENQISVAVDNSANDRIYPQKADFTFYGGLYRDVNLICVPGNHFEMEKDGTPGIKVTPLVKGRDAEVRVGHGSAEYRRKYALPSAEKQPLRQKWLRVRRKRCSSLKMCTCGTG